MTRGIGAAQVGIGAVRVYQWTVRPFIGANCRFWPSCSDYAVEALRVHGAARGTVMAAKRILRCNPWAKGGIDDVPDSRHHHDHYHLTRFGFVAAGHGKG